MRFITLSDEELELVNEMEKSSSNHIVRLRRNLLKLSNEKISMKEVSRLTKVTWPRIFNFFNVWEKSKNMEEKIKSLFIKDGRGAKVKLTHLREIIIDLMNENEGNLNVVLCILVEKHKVKVCKTTLQTFLKERGV